RAYQLSHVLLALLVGAVPSLRLVLVSQPARGLWLALLLVAAAILLVQEMRRGDAEARTMALGALVLVAVQALEVARRAFPWGWGGVALSPFGFAAVLVAM
ncbi:MAG TPA: hypothetical protein DD490_28940, partial [Acidobacteria bacterium]|nr:hypothetical protein [Acidobacteriota bacterium]